MQEVAFSEWLLLLKNVHIGFVEVFSWLDSLFVSHCSSLMYDYITICLSIQPLKEFFIASGFWRLAVVNKATINSCVRIFVAVDMFLTILGE